MRSPPTQNEKFRDSAHDAEVSSWLSNPFAAKYSDYVLLEDWGFIGNIPGYLSVLVTTAYGLLQE
jgi:hypothetical protein